MALIATLGAVALVAACSGSGGGGVVDAAGLRELQADGVRVIDVRTAGEFAGARIPGAENVPIANAAAIAEAWDRTAPVVLYCATGERSAVVAETLRSMGFEEVYDYSGGMAAWDGEVEYGTVATAAPAVTTSGIPVLYEFYTDW
jgi:rhodanese-related sulfurtransferase